MRSSPRCSRCGEAIGVYEPMVVIAAGRVTRTSVLAHFRGDATEAEVGELFHDECFDAEMSGRGPGD